MLGVVVPKNIPLKIAAIKSSYDLEHLKNHGMNLYDKGPAKKVYLHLHKAVKGEDMNFKDGKPALPLTAPGQKIKVYDFSNGKIPS